MITAFISRKGGVGKTTSAVSLGAALARLGRRVLLVDLDPQASTSLSLGVERRALAPSMADVLAGHVPMTEAVRRTASEHLDLVTCSTDMAGLETDLGRLQRAESCLQRPLSTVADDYDFVFLDCPAGLSLLPRAAVAASGGYVVALSPQFLVLDGLRNFLDAIERTCFRTDSRARLLGMLLTIVDYRPKVTRQYVDEIREQYSGDVFGIEVRINTRLAEAPSSGQTIFQYAPKSTGARAYQLLADELLLRSGKGPLLAEETPAPETAPAPHAARPDADGS